MPTVRYSFSFDTDRDNAIIHWLDSQSNASGAVREVIQNHITSPSRADLEAITSRSETKLDRLLEMIRNMRTVEMPAKEAPAEGDEPAQARKGLDAMKKRFQKGER